MSLLKGNDPFRTPSTAQELYVFSRGILMHYEYVKLTVVGHFCCFKIALKVYISDSN